VGSEMCIRDRVMTAHLRAGEHLCMTGAASGIGAFAIQFAKAWGARVTALASTAEKADFCRTLGADAVHIYTDITQVENIDVALDMAGGDMPAALQKHMNTDGRMVMIACPGGRTAALDIPMLMQRRQQIFGTTLRSRPHAEKHAMVAALRPVVLPMCETGKIKPIIHEILPISQAARAHEVLQSRANKGKIILTAG
jgi:NADPH2:quinone reductase